MLGHRRLTPADAHDVEAVDLGDPDVHALVARRGEVLADVVGADRQLAVAAVDEDREPHGAGPAELGERVEGGADRATGVEHVVDEDDDLVVDATGGDARAVRRAHRVAAQVVAVERDVELADGDRRPLDLLDARRETARERDAARGDAEEDEPLAALVAFEDLVTDAP